MECGTGQPARAKTYEYCFVDVARDTSFGGSDESRESSGVFDGREKLAVVFFLSTLFELSVFLTCSHSTSI